jgi:VanZ family protein
MILFRPFSYAYASPFEMWWDYGTDVLLNVPVGAAAVLLWTRSGTVRRVVPAIALGTLGVASIELAQVFVRSRFADVSDLLTGAVGVTLGAMAITALSQRPAAVRESLARSVLLGRVGAVIWIGVLAAYHWNPFGFTLDPGRVSYGMHQFLAAPFSSYYEGSELHALTEAVRKAVLALPLGMFLQLSSARAGDGIGGRLRVLAYAIFGLCLLTGIEVGQIFLPGRTPDITDALIGEFGLLIGFWLTARVTALGILPRPASSSELENRASRNPSTSQADARP